LNSNKRSIFLRLRKLAKGTRGKAFKSAVQATMSLQLTVEAHPDSEHGLSYQSLIEGEQIATMSKQKTQTIRRVRYIKASTANKAKYAVASRKILEQ